MPIRNRVALPCRIVDGDWLAAATREDAGDWLDREAWLARELWLVREGRLDRRFGMGMLSLWLDPLKSDRDMLPSEALPSKTLLKEVRKTSWSNSCCCCRC